eukprot:612284-Rhodomonas_salina.4
MISAMSAMSGVIIELVPVYSRSIQVYSRSVPSTDISTRTLSPSTKHRYQYTLAQSRFHLAHLGHRYKYTTIIA